jgi:transposase
MDINDKQWAILEPLLPKPKTRADGKGRPWRDPRDVLNGILWILRTGAPWKDLPLRYPPYQTCHRRFQQWSKAGVLEKVFHALLKDLYKRGGIELGEAYIDGSFAGAKKGVLALVRQSAAKGPRSWQLQTVMAFHSRSGLEALRRMKLPS